MRTFGWFALPAITIHHPIGEVVAAALPTLLRQGKPLDATVQQLEITDAGASADLEQLGRRAKRQAELLTIVRQEKIVSFAALDDAMPGWRAFRKALLKKMLVAERIVKDTATETIPVSDAGTEQGPVLNADQKSALRSIREKAGFAAHLMRWRHG